MARITQLGKPVGLRGLVLHEERESQLPTAAARMSEEVAYLNNATPDGSIIFALDERGKTMTSEDFAAVLRKYADAGQSNVVFCLGGPDGHDPSLRKKAHHILAFGPMTWPHRLARIMLLEQIYRAITIMTNHPYHRA